MVLSLSYKNECCCRVGKRVLAFSTCYVCICATFSVEGENDQIIVTDFDPDNPDIQFRGISATK